MKKILLTLVGVICSLGMWADETIFSLQTVVQSAAVASDASNTDLSLTSAYATISGGTATMHAKAASTTQLAKGSNKTPSYFYFSGGASCLTITLTGGNSLQVGDIITYNTSVAANNLCFTSTGTRATDYSGTTTSTTQTYTVKTGDALIGATTIYVWRATSTTTSAAGTLTIVRPTASTDPSITASDIKIAYDATSGEIPYTITNPTSGVSLAASKTTGDWISNVEVGTEKVTFTATANTGVQRTATITLSYTGALNKVITVTQRKMPVAQQNVSEATTWDWSKTGATANIQLSDATTPAKNEEVILANVDDINNDANFRSDELLVSGEYIVRDAGKTAPYFQGGYIKFTTTVPGTIKVKFCNTGTKRPKRYVNVNGVNTAYGDNSASAVETGEIPVEAGDVKITGHFTTNSSEIVDNGDGTCTLENGTEDAYTMSTEAYNTDQYLRIYSITFTPTETITTNANGVASYVTTKALDFTNSDLTAFVATATSTGTVTLAKAKTVKAGDAIVVKAEDKTVTSHAIPVTSSDPSYATNLFKGSNSSTYTVVDADYVYALNTTGSFQQVASGVTIPAGKAYLKTDAALAKTISLFDIDDDATAVNAVASEVKATSVKKSIKNGRLVIETANGTFNAAGARIK